MESDSRSETIGSYHTPRDDTVSGVDSESKVDISARSEQIAGSSSDQRHRVGMRQRMNLLRGTQLD